VAKAILITLFNRWLKPNGNDLKSQISKFIAVPFMGRKPGNSDWGFSQINPS
jgi:hypothetical protein